MTVRRAFFGLAAVIAFSTQACAFDETIGVPAGRTSQIATFSANNSACHLIGKPVMTVPVKPKHGSVAFKWVMGQLGDGAGLCKGRKGHMMGVFYTPAKGYRGEDHFRIGMSFPEYDFANGMRYSTEDLTVMVR